MTILDRILKVKAQEIVELINIPLLQTKQKTVPTLKSQLANKGKMQVIAEIKRASPSKGPIAMDVDPVEQAREYENAGAAAISVLTDQTFFHGSMKDLQAVSEAVNIPVLCKDFIVDTIQIDHAKAAGAQIILLIIAALDDEQFKLLYRYCREINMEVLVEVHNEEEMTRALAVKPEIIGINNRDLKTFAVDLEVTERLAQMVEKRETQLISESGMKTTADVERVATTGANAILVGETMMRTSNIQETFQSLQVPVLVEEVK